MINEIDRLRKENEELKLKLEEERMVKKSEVLMNRDLKVQIEKHELLNETLIKINEEFGLKIAKLRWELKNNINKI
jgi:hypothetical protein